MKQEHKAINYIMVILMFVSMFLVAKETAKYVASLKTEGIHENTVVIDAGHGRDDGGKIGINGALEKDINLNIALRVEDLLKNQGVHVVMTRVDDKGTYPGSGSNRKIRDMEKRVEVINKEKPALTVSIHQNSYTDESVSGAQVFYFTGSEDGRRAAKLLQEQFITTLAPDKERQAKENGSYYLLKNVDSPIIIAECGFLSNRKEAELLCDEEYQEKIAWAIHLSVIKYLNGGESKEQ